MPEFVVPEDADLAALERWLIDRLGLDEGEEFQIERSWYDTFDWRLHRAGIRLRTEPRDGRVLLTCLPRASREGTRVGHLLLSEIPRFAWDLPQSDLRESITGAVEMRALLPRAMIQSASKTLIQRNRDEKTILRLAVDRPSVMGPQGPHPLRPRITVLPLRGYGKAAKRAARFISRKLGLRQSKADELTAASQALGVPIGGYSSKLDLKLDPTARADLATKQICRRLLEVMDANVDGMCLQVDTEFLHDFRVAVRRTRSALSRLRGVFPSPTVQRFGRELRWVGQMTGPARDYDVYLLQLDDLIELVPEPMREALEPLRPWLEARHVVAHRELVDAVSSPRFKKLMTDWRTFLGAPVPKRSSLPNAQLPLLTVARAEIWRVYRRALRDGGAIKASSPTSELHDLRKTCKKLRYLLEFFRSLFPGEAMSRLIGALKILQGNLGAIQDLEVQADSIAAMSEPLHRQESAATLMAIGVLVDQLRRRQAAQIEAFGAVFTGFAAKDNRQLARKLFQRAKGADRKRS